MMNEATKKTLIKFFSKYPLKKYKKGELILRPGDKFDFVGFIKSGFIRVYTKNKSGQEITMSFFKPIFCFTTLFTITGRANKFYFESVSPVELWVVSKADFEKFCETNKKLMKELMELLAQRFLNLVENMGKLLSRNSLSKVALIVTEVVDNKAHFALTHKMIASLTGLTRETVTLQMLKLEKMKLVDNKNRKVIILDRDGLDKLIGK